MSALIIDGKALAASERAAIKAELAAYGRPVGLAVVLVGSDAGSAVYVRNKIRACEEVGIVSFAHRLPDDATQSELDALIDSLNADDRVDGILVQLPLPRHLDPKAVIARIDPAKDVDCFHAQNVGKLLTGEVGLRPCTPCGILRLIESTGVPIDGKRAVVVGRSNIVGKPVAMLLLEKNATVTIAHSHTRDLASVTREADILVVAVGRPRFVTAQFVKPGATVIDVGINRLETLVGDVDFDSVAEVAGAITPVPGGVGPMTIAMLLRNALLAARMRHG